MASADRPGEMIAPFSRANLLLLLTRRGEKRGGVVFAFLAQ